MASQEDRSSKLRFSLGARSAQLGRRVRSVDHTGQGNANDVAEFGNPHDRQVIDAPLALRGMEDPAGRKILEVEIGRELPRIIFGYGRRFSSRH